jgi:hypothetical protein
MTKPSRPVPWIKLPVHNDETSLTFTYELWCMPMMNEVQRKILICRRNYKNKQKYRW